MKEYSYIETYKSRVDLKQYKENALMLFALQVRFNIEDIEMVAETSLTGDNDKKADLIYIDEEKAVAVIAQAYICKKQKKGAKSNKADDLNIAATWLLNQPIEELPNDIKTHAQELRTAIKEEKINRIYFWYVHNLSGSKPVENAIKSSGRTARTFINKLVPKNKIEIIAAEISRDTIEEWYKSLSMPVLVTDKYDLTINGGYEIKNAEWKAYVTAIPAVWLYERYKEHKTKLFSANIRDYFGSRDTDKDINNGIKNTACKDPKHFWVYNNGITALVNNYNFTKMNILHIEGISIVNGAQTTGAIGSLDVKPGNEVMVPIRFITCPNTKTIRDIVKYNNYQNKIAAPDFRSSDRIQTRILQEFKDDVKYINYAPRRGGSEDKKSKISNLLPSVTAGQVLAAFHGDPDIAYHQKNHIWEADELYVKYFNDNTTAKHIYFAYTLLKAIALKKKELVAKAKSGKIQEFEQTQLDYLRKRGAHFLLISAIANSMEVFIDESIANLFEIKYIKNFNLTDAISKWYPIVNISTSFVMQLNSGLSDGFRTKEKYTEAISNFKQFINSTREPNKQLYNSFKSLLRY
ncbi:MAG: hypothetical protein A2509_08410 [Candidatus Edwardsbacteria bacterium RIFOXYD12_FULL_50_11]|uniref:Abortive phage infection protein C-terminal domain-containing protein n=1 Tax=Candidatus Edwardsbacteria bacterium GWF2_54_11 TaxID=1817851 RepID=A0A1F5RFK6_9BACT|nr:MAG: hypothetical protein A2502_01775 [Candidatus Edwardsbacteria bacterium RifOxyC12_full_54_24]OGF08996.1 MAG: hypothetical protein A2273_10230 [Candidatus Edwardsbacteria bacterium RifOxyA12_full_54_48]OGF12475.1 MAG: hypothetical protein A3K15_01350 [Candidatus Edwardsbacteria bacterium GWE2_54_12]OGF12883.1 MAG: hypothetical protein A2024_11685 [Candidatus Edwardsbacteria bacterium GWF2_54_11]OGF17420.1 MAG: hypothetical protein A2509_08410 [Candidatus Edwardsbacteria bacterium RIFOXYD1